MNGKQVLRRETFCKFWLTSTNISVLKIPLAVENSLITESKWWSIWWWWWKRWNYSQSDLIVGSYINHDWKTHFWINSTTHCVKCKFSNRNTHSTTAKVAQAKNTFPISNNDSLQFNDKQGTSSFDSHVLIIYCHIPPITIDNY